MTNDRHVSADIMAAALKASKPDMMMAVLGNPEWNNTDECAAEIRAIEQHEAFKQEVSDALQAALRTDCYKTHDENQSCDRIYNMIARQAVIDAIEANAALDDFPYCEEYTQGLRDGKERALAAIVEAVAGISW